MQQKANGAPNKEQRNEPRKQSTATKEKRGVNTEVGSTLRDIHESQWVRDRLLDDLRDRSWKRDSNAPSFVGSEPQPHSLKRREQLAQQFRELQQQQQNEPNITLSGLSAKVSCHC